MRWPTKCFGASRANIKVDPSAEGLIGGWNMVPVQNKIIDQSPNGNDGILYNVVPTKTSLGDAYSFNGIDSYIDFGNIGTIKSFSCWIKPRTTTEDIADFDSGTHTLEVSAGTLTATGWTAPIIYINGVVSSTLAANIWQYIQITTETGFAANAFLLGKETTYFDGYICKVSTNSDTLSTSNAIKGYQEGLDALHFKSDWGARESIVSEGGTKDGFLSNTPLRFGDTTGRFKIESEEIEGHVSKVIACYTAGLLYLPTSLFTNPTEAMYGRFDMWFNKADTTDFSIGLICLNANVASGYGISIDNSENCIFEEFGVGTIIDAGTIDHSTWYNIKSTVKRIASNNEFELFINNTSQGTGTDNSFTESKFIVLSMGIGDKIAYADLSGGHNIIKGATS